MIQFYCLRCLTPVTLTLLLTILACNYNPTDAVVISKIDRTIDLSSQLVKIIENIYLEDTTDLYKINIDPKHRERLAFIEATHNGETLALVDKLDNSYELKLSNLNLKKPLVITSIYTELLKPYPAEIYQNERQMVRYEGLQTTLSPYLIKTIKTQIKLPQSSRLESFTRASKLTTGSNKITYGPFTDVQPDQAEALTIHFENNTPFVVVKQLTRTVEVSPWFTSVNVENKVKVKHIGAKLKGPFSRLEYQRDYSNGISSVKNFVAQLPKASKNIYFRDGIGNISTSAIRGSETKTIVDIKPRFPLFGGWGTEFTLGYNIPGGIFVRGSGDDYKLRLPFSDVLYDNMFVEDATINIHLPLGASDIRIEAPFSYERLPDDKSGKSIVVLSKKNIVPQLANKMLVIRFKYSLVNQLQEPYILVILLLVAYFLIAPLRMVLHKLQRSKVHKDK